jgi:hypothetical protein
MRKIGK